MFEMFILHYDLLWLRLSLWVDNGKLIKSYPGEVKNGVNTPNAQKRNQQVFNNYRGFPLLNLTYKIVFNCSLKKN